MEYLGQKNRQGELDLVFPLLLRGHCQCNRLLRRPNSHNHCLSQRCHRAGCLRRMRRVPLIRRKYTLHFNNQQRCHGQQYHQQYNHYRQRQELYRKYKFLPQHDRYHSYSQQALRALLLDRQFKWEMLHLVLILLHGIHLLSQNQLLLIKSHSPVMVLDSHLVGAGMLS